jgi:hypothetical protein
VPYGRTAQPVVISRQPQSLVPAVDGQTGTGGLDIRSSFNNFIEPYGQMVIVQRLNLSVHCSHCWNEKEGEGDPQCAYCLGRGYQSVLERHISRRVSSLSEHRTQLLEQSSPGDELVDEVFWFFEYNVNPSVKDMVYEVSWTNGQKTVVDHLLDAYEVTYAFPFRAAGGRIEFWRISAKTKPIDRGLVGQHLRRLASSTLLIPADGVLRQGS